MKERHYKRGFFWLLAGVGILLCLIAGLVILADPFFQYHKPIPGLHYVIDNQLSQNAGMIKNFEYDSVIVGSSMTVNFDTDVFKEAMNLNTLKVSTNAATPKDMEKILSMVQEYNPQVKAVFASLDAYNFAEGVDTTAYPYPEYLYDRNLFNDVSYLFNKDVILSYILKPQIQKTETPLHEAYWSWVYRTCGKEAIAQTYTVPQITGVTLPKEEYLAITEENMRVNILPIIEQMPDTKFVFFFPPYSILYWYNRMAEGCIEAELAQMEKMTELLLAYPNVQVYTFQNEYEYITNYENYFDYSHYSHEKNDDMTWCFALEKGRLTQDNYKQTFDQMQDWLLTFDYENCW